MIETMELANKVVKVAIKVVIKMQGQMSIHCVVHLKLIYFISKYTSIKNISKAQGQIVVNVDILVHEFF